MVCLADITPDNWRLELSVAESQKTWVANPAALLARAYAYRHQNSRAFLVYKDETPVGMGLYYDCPELDSYDLSQLFIPAGNEPKSEGPWRMPRGSIPRCSAASQA